MTNNKITNDYNKIGFLNLAVILLSSYVIIALLAETFFSLSNETIRLLNFIDLIICVFFFLEFLYRFYKAKNKLQFLKWGWIDLISCIPAVDYLRIGRIFRLIRLIRILRAFKSAHILINYIFSNKAKGTLTSVALISILIVIVSSIAILQVENSPNSNIKTAEDAIWWSYTTITTVGYGDKYPVTTEGRIIAMILMTVGVGLFGTFTAYIASKFLDQRESSSTLSTK